jgi:hypothetical protein
MEHIKKLAVLIVTALKTNPDGFTIDIKGNDQAGKKAYAVSPYKKYELSRNFTRYNEVNIRGTVEAWLNEVQHLLPYPFGLTGKNTDHCIGGWSHEGKTYLDVVALYPKSLPLEHVNAEAKRFEQIAFFDLETLTEIKTT